MEPPIWVLIIFLATLSVVGLLFVLYFGRLWMQAMFSGCPVPIRVFLGMWMRKVNSRIVIDSLIMATKAGVTVVLDRVEAHYLAKGKVDRVMRALVAASKANIPLGFDQAAAIDLAGRDVLGFLNDIKRVAEPLIRVVEQ